MAVVACEDSIRGGFEKMGFGEQALKGEILFEVGGFGVVFLVDRNTTFVSEKRWFYSCATGWFGCLHPY